MPADANADNVYELKLQATDLRQPHVAVFTVDQVNGEICICEPTMGIRHKLSIPRQLQAITTTDGQTYLHTHRSNDGTIALYRSEVNESGWQSRLLQADCHLSPFATALAEGTDSTFLSVQQCRDGFELQAMQLDDNYQFSRVGSPIPLETTVNPIGLSCLGDGDYQLLDAYGGNAVLTEMAISDNVIVGCRSLPVGWDFSGSRVLAMAAWTDVSAETSRATRAPEQVVHIRVQPIPPR